MKALFGAAHLMECDLTTADWHMLVDAMEIIVGFCDLKVNSALFRLPTRYHKSISAIRVDDEDVSQQLE